MAELTDLIGAQGEIRTRVAAVKTSQWSLPTPCRGWSVTDVVVHLVEGSRMALRLLDGASADEAGTAFGAEHGDDLAAELASALGDELAAFERPGALEMNVHHRVGDLPATTFLEFRTGDYLLHSWDLARATGTGEHLPDDLVSVMWESMQPMAPYIATTGYFGDGPSGKVAQDAPLQLRLLDLTGRRP
jgi:uncharacterized protein (TIGR03086 family)